MGQGREGSEEGQGSWCNVTEIPANFEEIPDSRGRLDSVAASRRGHRTRSTDSFLIPWDLNYVANIVVVVVIEIVNKRVRTSRLPVCQRTSAVPYRHRPIHYSEYHDRLNWDARELIGGLTLASLGHHTTGSTYMMMMMMMMIDGTTRSTSEPGPTLCLNCWMRTVEERVRKENVSELERDVLLAFEEQGSRHRLPLPAPPRPPRCSAEPSHPWIDQCRRSTNTFVLSRDQVYYTPGLEDSGGRSMGISKRGDGSQVDVLLEWRASVPADLGALVAKAVENIPTDEDVNRPEEVRTLKFEGLFKAKKPSLSTLVYECPHKHLNLRDVLLTIAKPSGDDRGKLAAIIATQIRSLNVHFRLRHAGLRPESFIFFGLFNDPTKPGLSNPYLLD